jgi:type 1 fimbriae regulatory protein FimB
MHDRKHLVSAEVEKLLDAAKGSRHAARDLCLLLLMFSHGLRVSEVYGLTLAQVDTESRVLHVARLKQGLSTTHPLQCDELRAIRAWLAERAKMQPETDAFFISERRRPLSRKTAWVMIRTYDELAGLPVDAHPHMLRHACGFALADQGTDTRLIQDYLGHWKFSTPSGTRRPTRHGLNGCGGKIVPLLPQPYSQHAIVDRVIYTQEV